jgi:hypothetical protein
MVSWIVDSDAFKNDNSDATVDLYLMKGDYETSKLVGPIKTNMDNDVFEILWYVNKTLPIGDDYILNLRSKNIIQCFSPIFPVKAFNGDSGSSEQILSHKGVPMVVPAAPGRIHKRSSIVENAVSSSPRKADGRLANLIAGLLVFGAFLWA